MLILYIFFLLLINNNTMACKVLSLSGGGSYGAYEFGVISHIIENNEDGGKWDLITGVSAGSINTLYLGTILPEDEKIVLNDLKELWWNTKSNDIYSYNFFMNGYSLMNTEPLEKTITKLFQNRDSYNLLRTFILLK